MDLVFIFSRLFKWFCISIEEVSHLNVKNKKIEKSMLRIIARKNTFDNKLTFGAIVLTIIIAISFVLVNDLRLILLNNCSIIITLSCKRQANCVQYKYEKES